MSKYGLLAAVAAAGRDGGPLPVAFAAVAVAVAARGWPTILSRLRSSPGRRSSRLAVAVLEDSRPERRAEPERVRTTLTETPDRMASIRRSRHGFVANAGSVALLGARVACMLVVRPGKAYNLGLGLPAEAEVEAQAVPVHRPLRCGVRLAAAAADR